MLDRTSAGAEAGATDVVKEWIDEQLEKVRAAVTQWVVVSGRQSGARARLVRDRDHLCQTAVSLESLAQVQLQRADAPVSDSTAAAQRAIIQVVRRSLDGLGSALHGLLKEL